MTNLYIGLLVGSTLLSGASVSVGFYFLHTRVSTYLDVKFAQSFEDLVQATSALRGGITYEAKELHLKVETEASKLHSKVESVEKSIHNKVSETLTYVENHAGILQAHAEDLRNHAKNITDVASAAKFAITRQAPSR